MITCWQGLDANEWLTVVARAVERYCDVPEFGGRAGGPGMFALKQALFAKERHPQMKVTLFYMDLRAFGKDYERYIRMAEAAGIELVRAMPSVVRCNPAHGDVTVSGETIESGTIVITGGRIAALGADVSPPAGAELIDSSVRGPAIIGADTRVVGSYIGPYTSVSSGCEIIDSEIAGRSPRARATRTFSRAAPRARPVPAKALRAG